MSGVRFRCGCGRRVRATNVEAVLDGGSDLRGVDEVIVSFHCVCQEPEFNLIIARYVADPTAVEVVTACQGVPWRNPDVKRPVTADHPDVLAWRWLLDKYGGDVDAFVEELKQAS